MNKYNLIIFIILIFDFQFTYGQDYIPDSVRGIIIADSIVNSKNIESVDSYFGTNLDFLETLFDHNFQKIIIYNFDLIEFIWVYSDMSQHDLIRDPHKNLWLSYQELIKMKKWYRKNREKITLCMLKNFIKINYMAFSSDKEQERLEEKLARYRSLLKK